MSASEISRKVKELAKNLFKLNTPFLEIVQRIEAEIVRLKEQSIFPVDHSINDIVVHYSARYASSQLKNLL